MLLGVLKFRTGRETVEVRGRLARIAGDCVTHGVLPKRENRQGIEKRVAHGKARLCLPDGVLHAEVCFVLKAAVRVRPFESALKLVESRRSLDAFVTDVHTQNESHVEREDRSEERRVGK